MSGRELLVPHRAVDLALPTGSCSKSIRTKSGGLESSGLMNLVRKSLTRLSEKAMFESNRQFKLWDYNVSHQQLLLRSPRTGNETNNLDVVFWGVKHVCLPSILDELSLRLATTEEANRLSDMITTDSGVPVFRVQASDGSGVVVADGCKVMQNELEIFDSSLVYFDRDRPKDEYGVVIVQS